MTSEAVRPSGATAIPVLEESGNRRLLRLDARIRNQFDLITSRTGWLLTSHAFLLTALAATLNVPAGHPSAAQTSMRGALLLLLPVVGTTTSFVVWKAIMAAYVIVGELKQARDVLLFTMSQQYGYELTTGQMYSAVRIGWGDFPPKILPLIMLAVWTILLVFAVNVVVASPDFQLVCPVLAFVS